MSTAAWDKGTPTAVRMVTEKTFVVESFRGEAKSYDVNLETGACSCPHYQARLVGTGESCKHIDETRRQRPFLLAAARAKTLSEAALDQFLAKYANHPVIGGAIRVELARRRREAAENEARLEIFR